MLFKIVRISKIFTAQGVLQIEFQEGYRILGCESSSQDTILVLTSAQGRFSSVFFVKLFCSCWKTPLPHALFLCYVKICVFSLHRTSYIATISFVYLIHLPWCSHLDSASLPTSNPATINCMLFSISLNLINTIFSNLWSKFLILCLTPPQLCHFLSTFNKFSQN